MLKLIKKTMITYYLRINKEEKIEKSK